MEEKKELSMEVRLLLAFLLMGVVLFVTPYFYKQPPQPTPQSAAKTTPANPASAESGAGKTLAPPVSALPPSDLPSQSAESEETITVDTDLYRVVFSNRGAVVRS